MKQKLALKKEDLGSLPEGWQAMQVKNAAERLKPGKLFDEKSVFDKGSIPVVNQSKESLHGYHDEEPGVEATRESPVTTFANHTCHMRLLTESFSCIQNVFPRVGKEGVCDTKFLHYATLGRVTQAGYKGHEPYYRDQWIPLPPIEEQEKIGDILFSYDELIENNRRRIQLLEESARLLYREWFVHLRFPGHEHVKVVDGVPEGWERHSVSEVSDILSGGTPKTSVEEYWGGDIPFFTPKDATDSIYARETEKTLTESGLNNCSSQLYPKNTIFITARGTVGRLNLAQMPMAMNQSCYALVAKEPLNQLMLYFGLQSAIEYLKNQAAGAVFDAIIRDTFKRIPFLVPSEGLITDFTEVVEPIIQQIDNLSEQNRKLAEARDLLLPRLMNGEIAV